MQQALLILFLCFFPVHSCFARLFGDDMLWKSGDNLYIKLDKQDTSWGGKTSPNDHPVTLDSKEITNALMQVEYWEKPGSSDSEQGNKVFAASQARILGTYLAKGLAVAKPDQDIVFTLATLKKLALSIIKDKVFMAGRAFYKDNHLNIIIGDYDRPTDRGMEAAAGGAGVTEVKYFLNEGKRGKESGFKKTVITGNGIELHLQGNRKRRDWLVIDVPAAAQAYVARLEAKQNKNNNTSDINTEALEAESEKLAKERREMRAEMARMRKEMEEMSSGEGGSSTKTIEERIATLDELLEKKLITKEEYDKKRKEILSDI